MNILFLLVKNTAALDFALPLLVEAKRRHPAASISVLYCRPRKKQLLRDARYYSDEFGSVGIAEYDLGHFVRGAARMWLVMLGWIVSGSTRDSRAGRTGTSWIRDWNRKLQLRLERAVVGSVQSDDILALLRPDIILLDHTSSSLRAYGDFIHTNRNRYQGPIILVPHAPHHAKEVAFTPYGQSSPALPKHCEFWIPFLHEKPWKAVPDLRDQFVFVGYPGLDTAWINGLIAQRKSSARARSEPSSSLTCMFVIRRFLSPHEARGPGDNEFVYSYEEMAELTAKISRALRKLDRPVTVVVKPHPSTNFTMVRALLVEAGFPDWTVSSEPTYDSMRDIDFVVGLYSTVLFIPILAGIPGVLLSSSTQEHVHKWLKLKSLYTGLQYYVDDHDGLESTLAAAAQEAIRRKTAGRENDPDIEHLRRFFPDGAIDRGLDRIFNRGNTPAEAVTQALGRS